jgi:hypothetical protein
MRDMLEGVTDGAAAAARQGRGQNISADAKRLQHLARAVSRTARSPTAGGQRVIDRMTAMLAVQLSFIANLPQFNLRQGQDIKYVSNRLARRRDV